MAKETITTPSSPGAGRTFDVLLQLLEGTTISTASRSNNAVGRASGLSLGSIFSTAGGGGSKVFQNGMLANNFAAATGDAQIWAIGADHLIAQPTYDQSGQEVGALRFICTMKVTGLPATFPTNSGPASDFGLCFYGNSNLAGMSNMFSTAAVNGNSGFGFACDTAGHPAFVVRKTQLSGGAADEVTVLSTAFVMTDWCTWDIRLAGATVNSPATLTAVVNGVTVLTRSWSSNTLPTAATMGANYLGAFRPIVGTASGSGVTSLQVAYARLIKAPTFSALF